MPRKSRELRKSKTRESSFLIFISIPPPATCADAALIAAKSEGTERAPSQLLDHRAGWEGGGVIQRRNFEREKPNEVR